MVLGHEPAGVIEACGAGVTGWSAGDRVALEPAVYCYHCEYCLTGRHNVCASLRFLSQPGDPGFFRSQVVLPAANLLALPQELGFAEATLFEPLAVVLHSLRLAALGPAESAAVFGAGPIGLLTIAALRLAGAVRVLAVEPVAERRALALALGADAALDVAGASAGINAETGGRGVDVAFDCATCGDSINECSRSVRRTGRVVVTGIPSGWRSPIDLHTMRRKEITLLNVRRSNRESELALHLLRESPRRFVPILTHRRPLTRIGEAFRMAAGRTEGAAKVVLEP